MTQTSHFQRVQERVEAYRLLTAQGQSPNLPELCKDCPELIADVQAQINPRGPTIDRLESPFVTASNSPTQSLVRENLPSPSSVIPIFPQPAVAFPEIIGDFRLSKILGSGGMGTVYLAEDVRLRRKVAVKVMRAEFGTDPIARERFFREARAVAAIEHDHIVSVYSVGEHHLPDGRTLLYLAMPLLKGESLEDRLSRAEAKSESSLAQISIARQIAEGLAAAHEQHLVHRDIKPANIWIETRPDGSPRVKILDFGLASDGEGAHLTQPNMIVGTPHYMSPEQATGSPTDGRADLFCLGSTLYRMATGQLPFSGQSPLVVLSQVVNGQPTPISQLNPTLPSEYLTLIEQLMEKPIERRPASAAEVAQRLHALELTLKQADIPMAMPINATLAPPTVPMTARWDAIQAPQATEPVQVSSTRRISRMGWLIGGAIAASMLLAVGAFIANRTGSIGKETTITDPEKNQLAVDSSSIVPVQLPDSPKVKSPSKPTFPIDVKLPAVAVEMKPIGSPFTANTAIEPRNPVRRPTPIPGAITWGIASVEPFHTATAAWRPDGLAWASFGIDGWTRIYDRNTGRITQMIPEGATLEAGSAPDHVSQDLSWSPDGSRLAMIRPTGVHIWDIITGQLLRDFPRPTPVIDCAFSPDGRSLLIVEERAIFRVDLASEQVRELPIDEGKPQWTVGRWSPDGLRAAIGDSSGTIVIVEASTGKRATTLKGHTARVRDLAWNGDGTRLASCSQDQTIHIWNPETATVQHRIPGSDTLSISWSPDRTQLAAGGIGAVVQILDVASGKTLRTIPTGTCLRVAWSPRGDEILAGGYYDVQSYRIHDAITGAIRQRHPGRVSEYWTQVAESLSGRIAIFSSQALAVWSPQMQQCDWQIRQPIAWVSWAPSDALLLICPGGPMPIQFRDARTGNIVREIPELNRAYRSANWSPDGRWISLTANQPELEKRLSIIDGTSLQVARYLELFPDGCQFSAFSPNSRMLAVGSVSGEIAFIDTKDWIVMRQWKASPKGISQLAWSPDGKRLASRSPEHQVAVWNVETNQPVMQAAEGLTWYGLQWLSNDRLAFNQNGNSIEWDATTGKQSPRIERLSEGLSQISGQRSPDYLTENQQIPWLDRATRTILARMWVSIATSGTLVSEDGHIRASPRQIEMLRYVVATDQGLRTLTAEEFTTQFGWHNDLTKPKITTEKLAQVPPPKPVSFIEKPGQPLGTLALVQQPAPLPGLKSWTITPRDLVPNAEMRITVSPDEALMAIRDGQGMIQIREIGTDTIRHRLCQAHITGSLAFSHDGRFLAVSDLTHVSIWEIHRPTARLVHRIAADTDGSFSWSPDGRTLVIGTRSGEEWHHRLMDVATGVEFAQLHSPVIGHTMVYFWSKDSRYLIMRDQAASNLALLWDVTTRSQVAAIAGEQFAWNDIGQLAALDTKLHRVSIYGSKTFDRIRSFEIPEGTTSIHWTQTEHELTTQGTKYEVWDTRDGKHLRTLGNADPSAIYLAKSGRELQTQPGWESIQLKRIRDGELMHEILLKLKTRRDVVTLPKSSQALFVMDGVLERWDLSTMQPLPLKRTGISTQEVSPQLTLSVDGKQVSYRHVERTGSIFSTETGERLFGPLAEFLALAPDGKTFLRRGEQHAIELCRLADAQPIRDYRNHALHVNAAAFTKDGKRFVSIGSDLRLCVWNTETGKLLHERQLNGASVTDLNDVCWSRDETQIGYNLNDQLHVWTIATNQIALLHRFSPNMVSAPMWAPDGQQIVHLDSRSGLHGWDAKTLRPTFSFDTPLGASGRSTAFAADNRTLIATPSDRVVFYDTTTKRLISTLIRVAPDVDAIISADGHWRGTNVEAHLIAVVLTDADELIAMPLTEFVSKYGWKNDPQRVRMLAEGMPK